MKGLIAPIIVFHNHPRFIRRHTATERLKIAAAEPERVHVVDASGSVQETHAQVLRIVMPFIEGMTEIGDQS